MTNKKIKEYLRNNGFKCIRFYGGTGIEEYFNDLTKENVVVNNQYLLIGTDSYFIPRLIIKDGKLYYLKEVMF